MSVVLDAFDWDRLATFPTLAEALLTHPSGANRELVVLGKTEGTATLNDFSREMATAAAAEAVRAAGGQALLDHTTMLFSTVCMGHRLALRPRPGGAGGE